MTKFEAIYPQHNSLSSRSLVSRLQVQALGLELTTPYSIEAACFNHSAIPHPVIRDFLGGMIVIIV